MASFLMPALSLLVLGLISISILRLPHYGRARFRLTMGALAFACSLLVAHEIGSRGPTFLGALAGPAGSLWQTILEFLQSFRTVLKEQGWGYLNETNWLLSMVMGLGALLLYAILRLVVLSIAGLVRKIDRAWLRIGKDLGKADLIDWSQTRRLFAKREAAFFFRTFAFLFYLIVALGPFFIALNAEWQIAGNAIGNWIGGIENVVWFGIYALSLEVAGSFDPKDLMLPHRGKADPTTYPADLDVERLFNHLRTTFEDSILLARRPGDGSLSALSERDDEPGRISVRPKTKDRRTNEIVDRLASVHGISSTTLDRLRGPLDDFIDGRSMLLFDETLAEGHYALLVELCQATLNAGGHSLIVCPDAILPDVKETLLRLFRASYLHTVQRLCIVGQDPPSQDVLFSVVVVPESLFEREFLDQSNEFDAWLRRLRLLVCLEMQHLDLSQLRLRLERLRQLIPRPLYVVGQIAERDDGTVIAMDVFSGEQDDLRVTGLSLVPETAVSRYLLIWRHGQAAADSIREKLLPRYRRSAEALPLTVLASLEQHYPVVVFDPTNRVYPGGWNRLADHGVDAHEELLESGLGSRLRNVPHGPHIGGHKAAQVVYVEDCFNLPATLRRNYNYRSNQQILLNIVSHSYPLRDFFLDQVEDGIALSSLGDFLPMSPKPSYGVSELAYLMAAKLSRPEEGLAQREFYLDLRKLSSPNYLDRLGVSANRAGLENLFRRALGNERPEIESLRMKVEHEKRYRARVRGLHERRLKPQLTINHRGTTFDNRMLQDADRGTAFAAGTVLKLNEFFYQVTGIKSAEVEVGPYQIIGGGHDSRPQYVFAREFDLCFSSDSVVFESEPEPRTTGSTNFVLSHLQCDFERRTVGFYALEEGKPPFKASEPPSLTKLDQESHSASRRCRSILHIHAESFPSDGSCDVLAFTLCVVMHDVIVSAFPGQAHLLATISPQCELPVAETSQGALVEFLRRRYGVLSSQDGDPLDLLMTFPSVRDVLDVQKQTSDDRLDLFVVEDSDRDMGVVRSLISRGRLRFFKNCAAYAKWMSDHGHEKQSFHRFGAASMPEISDFVSATRFFELCAGTDLSAVSAANRPSEQKAEIKEVP